jgi:chromatin licensing and DNA replication factor 1
VFDERTSCMKPDLHVSINIDAVENDGNLKSESRNMHLRKVFRARLADFLKSYPEVHVVCNFCILHLISSLICA